MYPVGEKCRHPFLFRYPIKNIIKPLKTFVGEILPFSPVNCPCSRASDLRRDFIFPEDQTISCTLCLYGIIRIFAILWLIAFFSPIWYNILRSLKFCFAPLFRFRSRSSRLKMPPLLPGVSFFIGLSWVYIALYDMLYMLFCFILYSYVHSVLATLLNII